MNFLLDVLEKYFLFFFKQRSCISYIDSCFLQRLLDLRPTSKYLLLLGLSSIVPPRTPPNLSSPRNLVLMATVANFETHTSFGFPSLMQVLTLFQLQITHFLWYLQYIHNNRKEAAGLINMWNAGREKSQHALNRKK